MLSFGRGPYLDKTAMVTAATALPGRERPAFGIPDRHAVLGTALRGPWGADVAVIHLAMGCFWGAEKLMWHQPGVVSTAVGYMGGFTPHPTYDEVCSGRTGHTETVLVAYDPDRLPVQRLVATFWEQHDPTQGMRQGNDVGTQYRSAVMWTTDVQEAAVRATRARFASALARAGRGEITTQAVSAGEAGPFFYAEPEHQQYLAKNPGGYCPVHATGVVCAPD